MILTSTVAFQTGHTVTTATMLKGIKKDQKLLTDNAEENPQAIDVIRLLLRHRRHQ